MDGTTIAVLVLVGLVYLGGWAVCSLKGKTTMAVLAIFPFGGVIGLIMVVTGALRLAKPDSYWAERRYDEITRARAEIRFPLRR